MDTRGWPPHTLGAYADLQALLGNSPADRPLRPPPPPTAAAAAAATVAGSGGGGGGGGGSVDGGNGGIGSEGAPRMVFGAEAVRAWCDPLYPIKSQFFHHNTSWSTAPVGQERRRRDAVTLVLAERPADLRRQPLA